jgi:Na+-driven multidrug efflux pump
MHICTAVMRGLGKSMTATVAMLLGTCALRVVWLETVFVAFPTLEVIYWSYPVSWVVTGVTLFGMLLFQFYKMGKQREV